MLNSIVLAGHRGEDPKISYSGDGGAVASFSFAFHSNGKKEKTPGWIRVICFKHLAEICQKYLAKGDKIAITGILEQNSWEGSDGSTKKSFQIIAHNIEFIKLKGNHEQGNDDVPF